MNKYQQEIEEATREILTKIVVASPDSIGTRPWKRAVSDAVWETIEGFITGWRDCNRVLRFSKNRDEMFRQKGQDHLSGCGSVDEVNEAMAFRACMGDLEDAVSSWSNEDVHIGLGHVKCLSCGSWVVCGEECCNELS
jgi:hypothetical protein